VASGLTVKKGDISTLDHPDFPRMRPAAKDNASYSSLTPFFERIICLKKRQKAKPDPMRTIKVDNQF